jgi:threonine/homoserine/homoserine lactone efflux protein
MELTMPLQWYLSLAAYIAIMAITPGPNNIMFASYSALHGFKKTLPLLAGAMTGLILVMFLIIYSGELILHHPLVRDSLRIISLMYLLYLAYKIAMAKPSNQQTSATALGYWPMLILQCVNPKVWTQAIVLVGLYLTSAEHYGWQMCSVLLINALIFIPCASLWTLAGKMISRYLQHDRHYRFFNVSMAVLLLVTVLPVVVESFLK